MFFINNKAVGLDITNRSIEAIEVEKNGNQVFISSSSRVILEDGVVECGRIKNKQKLSEAAQKLFAGAQPKPIITKKIIFCLPDSQAFVRIFDLPEHNKNQRHDLIVSEIISNIPIKSDDLLYSYKILEDRPVVKKEGNNGEERPGLIRVLSAAASKEAMNEWQCFFNSLEIKIGFFDLEAQAVLRGCKGKAPADRICLIDIGSSSTSVSVFDGEGLYYSCSFGCAGDFFTKRIADELKVGWEEAERIKLENGLIDTGQNNKAPMILRSALLPIVEEIFAAIRFFKEKTGKDVKEIIFVGGSSGLPGLIEFFSSYLTTFNLANKKNSDIQQAPEQAVENLFVHLGQSALPRSNIDAKFIEAVGLAWKGIDKKGFTKDLELSFSSAKINKNKIATTKSPVAAIQEIAHAPSGKFGWLSEYKKEAQLIAILLVGLIMLGGAFWYRDYSAKQRLVAAKNQQAKFSNKQALSVKILINTEVVAKSGQARGRILTTQVEQAISLQDAIKQARTQAEEKLNKGEKLWKESLDKQIQANLIFPFSPRFLAYAENDAKNIALANIKKQLGKTEFILSNLNFTKLESEETIVKKYSSTQYSLVGLVNILTDQPIQTGENIKVVEDRATLATSTEPATASSSVENLFKALAAAKQQTVVTENMIVIKQTSTGWLNVRSGAGTNFAIVKKIYPGETYELLQDGSNWVRIKISETESGWVAAGYVEKK